MEDQHLVSKNFTCALIFNRLFYGTLDPQQDKNHPNDWKIGATNVTEKFKDFRKHCVQNSTKYTDLDK